MSCEEAFHVYCYINHNLLTGWIQLVEIYQILPVSVSASATPTCSGERMNGFAFALVNVERPYYIYSKSIARNTKDMQVHYPWPQCTAVAVALPPGF